MPQNSYVVIKAEKEMARAGMVVVWVPPRSRTTFDEAGSVLMVLKSRRALALTVTIQ